ncbi:MAG: thiamine phosphate synthase [Rhodospirillales bacterium]|nr:thiamine phosphate synthase [Rhodospirillales bacterium]
MKPFDLSLYLVLDEALCRPRGMAETARAAVAGGATMVQLRDKHAGTAGLISAGRELQATLAGSRAVLIINDDPEAARALGVGLHIGQQDMQPREARARMGPDAILGLSVETEAAARRVDASLVDYVGIGPVFPTSTKPGHMPPTGIEGLARLVALCPVPAVAIGGLKAGHVGAVLQSGAQGLAVVSAICGTASPEAAARQIAAMIAAWRAGNVPTPA